MSGDLGGQQDSTRGCTPSQVTRRERRQGKVTTGLGGRLRFYSVGHQEWHVLSNILGRCNLAKTHRNDSTRLWLRGCWCHSESEMLGSGEKKFWAHKAALGAEGRDHWATYDNKVPSR